jgi:hypothetical protein
MFIGKRGDRKFVRSSRGRVKNSIAFVEWKAKKTKMA